MKKETQKQQIYAAPEAEICTFEIEQVFAVSSGAGMENGEDDGFDYLF